MSNHMEVYRYTAEIDHEALNVDHGPDDILVYWTRENGVWSGIFLYCQDGLLTGLPLSMFRDANKAEVFATAFNDVYCEDHNSELGKFSGVENWEVVYDSSDHKKDRLWTTNGYPENVKDLRVEIYGYLQAVGRQTFGLAKPGVVDRFPRWKENPDFPLDAMTVMKVLLTQAV